MTNYTFAYASAQAEAPDIGKEDGLRPLPAGRRRTGRANRRSAASTSRSAPSPSNKDVAFEAAACLAGDESQLTAVELDGLPPSRSDLYTDKVVTKAYPGFAELVKESIEGAGPRPTTPAYQDVSLGGPAHPAPAGQDRPRRHRTRSTRN